MFAAKTDDPVNRISCDPINPGRLVRVIVATGRRFDHFSENGSGMLMNLPGMVVARRRAKWSLLTVPASKLSGSKRT